MFLGNLLTEIGVHFLDPLLGTGDLFVVNVSDLNIIEGSHPARKLHRLFSIRSRRPLDLIFGEDREKSSSP